MKQSTYTSKRKLRKIQLKKLGSPFILAGSVVSKFLTKRKLVGSYSLISTLTLLSFLHKLRAKNALVLENRIPHKSVSRPVFHYRPDTKLPRGYGVRNLFFLNNAQWFLTITSAIRIYGNRQLKSRNKSSKPNEYTRRTLFNFAIRLGMRPRVRSFSSRSWFSTFRRMLLLMKRSLRYTQRADRCMIRKHILLRHHFIPSGHRRTSKHRPRYTGRKYKLSRKLKFIKRKLHRFAVWKQRMWSWSRVYHYYKVGKINKRIARYSRWIGNYPKSKFFLPDWARISRPFQARRFKRTWINTSKYKRLKSQRFNWTYYRAGSRNRRTRNRGLKTGLGFEGSVAYTLHPGAVGYRNRVVKDPRRLRRKLHSIRRSVLVRTVFKAVRRAMFFSRVSRFAKKYSHMWKTHARLGRRQIFNHAMALYTPPHPVTHVSMYKYRIFSLTENKVFMKSMVKNWFNPSHLVNVHKSAFYSAVRKARKTRSAGFRFRLSPLYAYVHRIFTVGRTSMSSVDRFLAFTALHRNPKLKNKKSITRMLLAKPIITNTLIGWRMFRCKYVKPRYIEKRLRRKNFKRYTDIYDMKKRTKTLRRAYSFFRGVRFYTAKRSKRRHRRRLTSMGYIKRKKSRGLLILASEWWYPTHRPDYSLSLSNRYGRGNRLLRRFTFRSYRLIPSILGGRVAKEPVPMYRSDKRPPFYRRPRRKYPMVGYPLRHKDFTLKLQLLMARMALKRHAPRRRGLAPLRAFLPYMNPESGDSRRRSLRFNDCYKFLWRKGDLISNRDAYLYLTNKPRYSILKQPKKQIYKFFSKLCAIKNKLKSDPRMLIKKIAQPLKKHQKIGLLRKLFTNYKKIVFETDPFLMYRSAVPGNRRLISNSKLIQRDLAGWKNSLISYQSYFPAPLAPYWLRPSSTRKHSEAPAKPNPILTPKVFMGPQTLRQYEKAKYKGIPREWAPSCVKKYPTSHPVSRWYPSLANKKPNQNPEHKHYKTRHISDADAAFWNSKVSDAPRDPSAYVPSRNWSDVVLADYAAGIAAKAAAEAAANPQPPKNKWDMWPRNRLANLEKGLPSRTEAERWAAYTREKAAADRKNRDAALKNLKVFSRPRPGSVPAKDTSGLSQAKNRPQEAAKKPATPTKGTSSSPQHNNNKSQEAAKKPATPAKDTSSPSQTNNRPQEAAKKPATPTREPLKRSQSSNNKPQEAAKKPATPTREPLKRSQPNNSSNNTPKK